MACAVLNWSSAFWRLMLDGVELAKDHAVFHAARLQGDDLLELGDGLIEGVAAGRGGRNGVLCLAELAQVDAAEQLVGIEIVGRGLEQIVRGGLGLMHLADAEIEVGEGIVELGRAGVGIEGILVLIDGLRDETRTGQC